MPITIPSAIKQLMNIVRKLQKTYPSKKFTLDGRLVGDIGEILVANSYKITLYEGLSKHHDAKDSKGRRVQIKATMKDSLTFPADHVPDYYVGIRIRPDGNFEEIFNGPGRIAAKAIKNRKTPKTNLHSISIRMLAGLNSQVGSEDRIEKRT